MSNEVRAATFDPGVNASPPGGLAALQGALRKSCVSHARAFAERPARPIGNVSAAD